MRYQLSVAALCVAAIVSLIASMAFGPMSSRSGVTLVDEGYLSLVLAQDVLTGLVASCVTGLLAILLKVRLRVAATVLLLSAASVRFLFGLEDGQHPMQLVADVIADLFPYALACVTTLSAIALVRRRLTKLYGVPRRSKWR